MGTFSDTVKNKMLDAVGANATYTAEAAVYAQLHTGDPGSAGTSNVATETTRAVVSMGAASSGSMTSDADTNWTNVAASETITWISFWSASSGGTFLGKDDLPSSQALTAGNNFKIPSGSLTLAI